MAFDSLVRGVWTFNQTLMDEVQDRDFSASSLSDITYKQFQKFNLLSNTLETRFGLVFTSGQSFTASGDITISDLTVAFWWFSPGHVEFTRHAVTRQLQTKIAPIVATTTTNTLDPVTLVDASFVISEISVSKTQNAIQVELSGNGANPTHMAISDAYDPGLHHVLVTYLSAESMFRVDIDGKL